MPEQMAYSQAEAAQALGISVNTFKVHVRPELKAVYLGSATRYPATELQAWLDRNVS